MNIFCNEINNSWIHKLSPKNSPRMVQIIFRRPGPTSTWTALRWDLGILGKSILEDHACAAAQDTEVQIYIIKLFAEIYIIYLYMYIVLRMFVIVDQTVGSN